jgi:hypothetical protein
MVIDMKNYLMINSSNIVENVCVWDGDNQTWTPPEGYTVFPQDETPAMVWKLLNGEYVLAEGMGAGQIGFTWNGTKCITNEPKPEPAANQPTTSGTQDI